jgi:polyether ionophore transport system permease protein
VNGLTGTWGLTRLALRRDRIILPLWVVGVSLFPVFVAASVQSLYKDPKALADFAESMKASPAITGFYGPIFSGDIGSISAWRSGVLLIVAALATGLTVIRHTRAEEEQGRRELIGAAVVGRPAPLAAALLLAGAACVLMALTVGGTMSGVAPGAGAWAFGVEYGLMCWLFAVVAGLAAQFTQSSRSARWILGAVLGGSFLLRAAGDSTGNPDAALSWISPIGFVQRIRPYAGERWWIAGVVLLVTVAIAAAAYRMSGRRDIDAGLVAPRPGAPRASRLLSSPLGLAWRLQRGSLIGWLASFAIISAVLGSAATTGSKALEESKDLADLFRRLGGGTVLSDVFMATLVAIAALAAAAQGIQAALRARSEETAGRVEPILAASVDRTRWSGGYALFALGGPTLSMIVLGVVGGLSYGAGNHDIGKHLPRVLGAALAALPAVWLTVGLVLAAFGLLPRLIGLGWVLLVAFLLLGQLGAVLRLPQWMLDLSPFTHIPHLPGAGMTWTPVAWLTLGTAALTAAGLRGFRRRDIG